ncbi:hypothetical protein E2R68_02230 [Psychromonas sp. RZ22]|uniref:hypothetical protein n=1 Tax=Psychromonas algarum TaxID=2555643 RepID=UPI00106897D6|nr:hypothetical protein [Psychromonas sp. RZ22]TEW55930.1 hypothetical protein E2R68_02230 [Psychromonas sp. RZ22]
MRYPLLFSIASSVALLSGCGEQSIDDNCRYYVQQDLDNKNYDDAITKLESTTCQDNYSDDDYLIDLASAYLGRAGYSLPSILAAVLDNKSTDDSFLNFSTDIADLKTTNTLANLQLSHDTSLQYLNAQCNDIADKTPTEVGICLTQAVIGLTKTALAIDFLSGGDIKDWKDNASGAMKQSTCAIGYSTAYTADNSISLPYSASCQSPIQVESSEEVTFSNGTISKTYQHLKVTGGTEDKYYLQSSSTDSATNNVASNIVFTENFCQTDFTVCSVINETTCYVCPSQEEDDLVVNSFVLDSLNDGLSNIDSLFAHKEDGNSDITEATGKFKEEIKPGGCDTTSDQPCFTMQDITDYLNKK